MYLHDFHVSVANIEFDKSEQALEISQRIFIDDFEKVLSKTVDLTNIDLILEFEKEKTKNHIKDYVLNNTQITVNGKIAKLNYLGAKLDGDVVVVFIESPNIKKVKSLSVKNTVFMEAFADQVNLVHLQVNGENRSIKLDNGKPKDTLVY